MTRPFVLLLLLGTLVAVPAARDGPPLRSGTVVDAATRAPIAGAIVTAGRQDFRTDRAGRFILPASAADVTGVRAHGYLRTQPAVGGPASRPAEIALTPFRPKALYLSVYGIGDRKLRTAALELIGTTEANALVIDLKGDRGLIPYRTAIPLAKDVGAQTVITIGDLPGLVASLHERGTYTIARIVVFKDTRLAAARPQLAVRRRDGTVFVDREKLSWTDPYSREVWDYNIGVAVEAARAGFDEIQFDYVRLPDAPNLGFDRPQTQENRQAPIEGFLRAARTALTPFNVFLAADVFGYICWNPNDTHIGQYLEHLADIVDYISPMLYPSSFQFGIPGYRRPVEHPYEIVRLSLERATARTHTSPLHFRPWLQAFRDYAFGGRPFTQGEVRAQIKAATDVGSDGWMLWNPGNRYSAADLAPESARPTR